MCMCFWDSVFVCLGQVIKGKGNWFKLKLMWNKCSLHRLIVYDNCTTFFFYLFFLKQEASLINFCQSPFCAFFTKNLLLFSLPSYLLFPLSLSFLLFILFQINGSEFLSNPHNGSLIFVVDKMVELIRKCNNVF